MSYGTPYQGDYTTQYTGNYSNFTAWVYTGLLPTTYLEPDTVMEDFNLW